MSSHSPFLVTVAEHYPAWACVILGLNPQAGSETVLTEAGLFYHHPNDDNHFNWDREVASRVIAQVAHAALGHAADRKQLSREPDVTPEALAGFDRIAQVLAVLVGKKAVGWRPSVNLPNIAYDGMSFARRVEAAPTLRSLRGLAIAVCREMGANKLETFGKTLEVEGCIPDFDRLPPVPDAALDIKFEDPNRDVIAMLANFPYPASIEPMKAQAISVRAARGKDKSIAAVIKANEVAADILSSRQLTPIEFAWLTIFMEMVLVISLTRDLMADETIFPSIDAYHESREPYLIAS